MKNSLVVRHFLGSLGVLSLAILSARADMEVVTSVQIHATADFEAPLAAHGAWIEVGSYGRCWRPAHMAVEWRPYGYGEWVWTDCGWYWSSDEPWAWACYHYGYWVYDSSAGWVWIPRVEWAPAWVSWRVGGGYIGWAPLPPPGIIFAAHPPAEHFVFVGSARFAGPVRPGVFVVNNRTIFKATSEISGNERASRSLGGAGSQKVFVNHGPSVEMVQKASGRTLAAVPVRDVARRNGDPAKAKHMLADAHDRSDKGDASTRAGSDHPDNSGDKSFKSGPDQDSAGSGNRGGFGGFGGRGGRGGGHGRGH